MASQALHCPPTYLLATTVHGASGRGHDMQVMQQEGGRNSIVIVTDVKINELPVCLEIASVVKSGRRQEASSLQDSPIHFSVGVCLWLPTVLVGATFKAIKAPSLILI